MPVKTPVVLPVMRRKSRSLEWEKAYEDPCCTASPAAGRTGRQRHIGRPGHADRLITGDRLLKQGPKIDVGDLTPRVVLLAIGHQFEAQDAAIG